MPLTDILFFSFYMIGILVFGCSFYFRNKSPESYTSGGGNLPSWVVGMSIFATFVSSISFLALPGNAYQTNWNGFVFSISIPIAAFMAVKFFVPLYRRINSLSAYAYLEERFGLWARIYASVCYLLTQIARMGSIMYLLALPMNALLGWDIPLIIIGTGICVLLYSMLGGIQAVIWTDAVQGIVLITGALLCAGILMFSMPDGPKQIFEIAAAENKLSLGSFGSDLYAPTFWVILVYGLFINLQNYGIDQNYVQRYMTTKTLKEARFSTMFGGLLYIPVSLLFFFIGTALYAFYKVNPGLLPMELQHLDMADKIFPYFIVHGLPKGITGLLIASIFAAGMSTVSTSLNSTSTVILTDYFERFYNRKISTKNAMKILYSASFVMGLLGIAVALAMTQVKSALDMWWKLSSIFSGGMLGLFLLGYFSARVKNAEAVLGVIVGALSIAWISLSSQTWLHTNLSIVIGTLIIFIIGFLMSRFTIGKKKEKKVNEEKVRV